MDYHIGASENFCYQQILQIDQNTPKSVAAANNKNSTPPSRPTWQERHFLVSHTNQSQALKVMQKHEPEVTSDKLLVILPASQIGSWLGMLPQ